MLNIYEFRLTVLPYLADYPGAPLVKLFEAYKAFYDFYEGECTIYDMRKKFYHLTAKERAILVNLTSHVEPSTAKTLTAELLSAHLKF